MGDIIGASDTLFRREFTRGSIHTVEAALDVFLPAQRTCGYTSYEVDGTWGAFYDTFERPREGRFSFDTVVSALHSFLLLNFSKDR